MSADLDQNIASITDVSLFRVGDSEAAMKCKARDLLQRHTGVTLLSIQDSLEPLYMRQ